MLTVILFQVSESVNPDDLWKTCAMRKIYIERVKIFV